MWHRTGQGAQWPQMGYSLVDRFPLVRRTLSDLDHVLSGLPNPPDWSLLGAAPSISLRKLRS